MKQQGFSLIELMIVVAIIGILSAVVYPSYTNYILRSKRTECRAALMQTLQQQERYFTQRNTYLAYTSSATGIPMKQFSGENAANSACTIKAEACASGTVATCVLLTGMPRRPDPVVGDITLQSDGAKTCTGTDQTKCWAN